MTTTSLDLSQVDLLALVGTDVDLKVAARHVAGRGPEYEGPCPECKSRNSLRVWPSPPDGRGNFWCRRCNKTGDAITYVLWREKAADFRAACQYLQLDLSDQDVPRVPLPPAPPPPCAPPHAVWQARAARVLHYAQDVLWSRAGAEGMQYLLRRGFTHRSIGRAELGYLDRRVHAKRSAWGLELRTGPKVAPGTEDDLFIPVGIVIPHWVDDSIWKLVVRRLDGRADDLRYLTTPGSTNALYNADSLRAGKPAMLVEGAFDALAVQQAAGDLIACVASGTTGARRVRWQAMLAQCNPVLLAFDAEPSGLQACAYWQDVLGSRARVWRPLAKDPADMQRAGLDIRAWVQAGLAHGGTV